MVLKSRHYADLGLYVPGIPPPATFRPGLLLPLRPPSLTSFCISIRDRCTGKTFTVLSYDSVLVMCLLRTAGRVHPRTADLKRVSRVSLRRHVASPHADDCRGDVCVTSGRVTPEFVPVWEYQQRREYRIIPLQEFQHNPRSIPGPTQHRVRLASFPSPTYIAFSLCPQKMHQTLSVLRIQPH